MTALWSLGADAALAVLLIGTIVDEGGRNYNAVLLADGGRVIGRTLKRELPNYGTFDEKRVFASGPVPEPLDFRGVRIGVPICEDIWSDEVVECLAETGSEILLVPNGSPYWRGKTLERLNIAAARVTESRLPLVYLNQNSAQDELVFDGSSFILNADCSLAGQLPASVLSDFVAWGPSLLHFASVEISSYDAVVTQCVATGAPGASITSYIHSIASNPGRLCQPTATATPSAGAGNGTTATAAPSGSITPYPTASANGTAPAGTPSPTSAIPTAGAARPTNLLVGAAAIGGLIGVVALL